MAGGLAPRSARVEGLQGERAGEQSWKRGAARDLSPSGRSPCPSAGLPGALRASSIQFAVWILEYLGAGLGRPGGGCCLERERVEPSLFGGSRRVFPQVPTLGTGIWSRDGRRNQRASPTPESGARLLLEKAAFLAGGVHRPLPLPPGPRARLEVSKSRRKGGSRRAGRWQGLWAGGSPRDSLVISIDGRDEAWSVSRVKAPVNLVFGSQSGGKSAQAPGRFSLEPPNSWALLGSTLPLYGPQQCRMLLLAPYPDPSRYPPWEGLDWALPTWLASCPVPAMSLEYSSLLPPRLTLFLGKGLNQAP